MAWIVQIADEFRPELDLIESGVANAILAKAETIKIMGPSLGRPLVDTLKGSKHTNMKELRLSSADGEWRVAFAFDTQRQAILLVVGDKSGVSQAKFYQNLIQKADSRFDAHLARLKGKK